LFSSVINLDVVCLSLFIFALLQFVRFKPEQAFQTLEEGFIICPATYWSDQISQMYASRSDSSILRKSINLEEQAKPHIANRMRTVRLLENMHNIRNTVRKFLLFWFRFSHRKSLFDFSRLFYLPLNEKVFLIKYKCCIETRFSRCLFQEFTGFMVIAWFIQLWTCWHYLLMHQGKSFNFSHYVALIKPRSHRSSGVFFICEKFISLSCIYLTFFLIF